MCHNHFQLIKEFLQISAPSVRRMTLIARSKEATFYIFFKCADIDSTHTLVKKKKVQILPSEPGRKP